MARLTSTFIGSAVALGAVLALVSPSGGAVIDTADRRTVAEWAAANHIDPARVGDRYGATGVVTCHWSDAEHGDHVSIATGQVTVRRDIVTLSGHTFHDPFYCYEKAGPNDCQFSITRNGTVQTAAIAEVLALGFDCDADDTSDYGDRLINDWAVARLNRMLDVVPYEIPDLPGPHIEENDLVVSVIHSQDYFFLEANGETSHPKTVGRCRIRDLLERNGETIYVTSDCDGAQRSSGGSLLEDIGEVPILIAVWTANLEDPPLLAAAVERMIEAGGFRVGLVNRGLYGVNSWSSRHVTVTGAFLDAIRAEVGRAP